jgi:hypothetical protein
MKEIQDMHRLDQVAELVLRNNLPKSRRSLTITRNQCERTCEVHVSEKGKVIFRLSVPERKDLFSEETIAKLTLVLDVNDESS